MCDAHVFAVDGGLPYKLYRPGHEPVSGIHRNEPKRNRVIWRSSFVIKEKLKKAVFAQLVDKLYCFNETVKNELVSYDDVTSLEFMARRLNLPPNESSRTHITAIRQLPYQC